MSVFILAMSRSLALPPDAQQRVAQRLSRVSNDLFLALDEIREHGGTYLSAVLQVPGNPQQFRLVLAAAEVTISDGTPVLAGDAPAATARPRVATA